MYLNLTISNLFIFLLLFRSGGPWLVTNMRRGESIYDLDPAVAEEIENGIENEGSNLSGVSAKLSWCEIDPAIMVSFKISFIH